MAASTTPLPVQSPALSDVQQPICRTLQPAFDPTTTSQSSRVGAHSGLLNKGSRCAQHLTHLSNVLASQNDDAMTAQDEEGIRLATSLPTARALQQATFDPRRTSIKPSTMRCGSMLARSSPLPTRFNSLSDAAAEVDYDEDMVGDQCLSVDSLQSSTKRTRSPQRSSSRTNIFDESPRRSSMRRPSSVSSGSALQQTPSLSSFGVIDDYEDEADLAPCAALTELDSTLAEEDEDQEPNLDNSDSDMISVNDYLGQNANRLSRSSSLNSFSPLTPSMNAESSTAAQPSQTSQVPGMFTRLTRLSPYTPSMYRPSFKSHGRSGSSATQSSSEASSSHNDSQLFDFDEAEELMDTDEESVPSEGSPKVTKPSHPHSVYPADKPASPRGQDSWYNHVDQWRLKTCATLKRNSTSAASSGVKPKESCPSTGPMSASAPSLPARRRITVLSQLSPLTPLHRY